MKVGFIGLGMMGKNAAANLLRAGFALTVHDLRDEAVAALVAQGATAAGSAAAVMAASDVVVTMVVGPEEVEAVLRGAFVGRLPGQDLGGHDDIQPVFDARSGRRISRSRRSGRGCPGHGFGRCRHSGRHADVCGRR